MSMIINSARFAVAEASFTVTVPSGKVTSNLTRFPLMVLMEDMPLGFWSTVRSDGGNIRAYASDGVTQLPLDVTYINAARKLGRMFIRTDLLSASNNIIVIKVLGPSITAEAVSATFGRNAVWADYAVSIIYPETVNRTGAVYTRFAGETSFTEWKRVDYYDMTGNPHQGVAVNTAGDLVTIDTNYLRRATQSAPNTVLASNADPVAAIVTATGDSLVNHLSDGCIIAGELWIAANEYPNTGGVFNEYLCVFNLTTLALDRYYNVSSVGRPVAGICFEPGSSTIYGVDYLDGTSMMKFSTSGVHLGNVTLSSNLLKCQGIEYVEGDFIISQEVLDLTRVSLTGTVYGAAGDEFQNPQGGISEGISYNPTTKKLFHMDGDGDMTVIEKVASISDWGRLHYDRHYETYPRSTIWSMGASVLWTEPLGDLQQAFLTMGNGSSNTQYATVTYDEGPDLLGLWNSTDLWLYSDINSAYKDQFRVAAQHNGTTQRKLFYNGILKATDNTIAARPSGTGTNMDFVINAATSGNADNGEAYYQYAWARNDYVSDAWMAADAANMNSPNTFYTIT